VIDVLLLRPRTGNERFGLGPFFRVEPLGLEYVAAALRARGARVTIRDERLDPFFRRTSPRARLIGLSCMHALEFDDVRERVRALRRRAPDAFLAVGGHAASAYPVPLEIPELDAIVVDDGEAVFPRLADAIATGRPIAGVPGLRLRTPDGWISTPPLEERITLDATPQPARDLIDRYRSRYHCLLFKPVWLVETARGCPFRCSFCSVWQLYDRSFRERSIGAVVEDLAACGDSVFIVDDLFWNHPDRSLALARALLARGVRKRWILVQSRTDLVARRPDLLEAWRPLARDFDIFFGLEAPSDKGLDRLTKDATVGETIEAARIAREHRYGVTGNFVVDPDWVEDDFRTLWDFVDAHRLQRAGYTILTPLPGTDLHRDHPTLRRDAPWFQYDMHHLLWEPRLGPRRFLELYAETWRRSILNLGGQKRWSDWMKQVRPSQIPYLTRVLLRTQRLMRGDAYLREYEQGAPSAAPAGPVPDRASAEHERRDVARGIPRQHEAAPRDLRRAGARGDDPRGAERSDLLADH
jgi:radical SAM superfamily enzyme YgiQ (UPF0313 family)